MKLFEITTGPYMGNESRTVYVAADTMAIAVKHCGLSKPVNCKQIADEEASFRGVLLKIIKEETL